MIQQDVYKGIQGRSPKSIANISEVESLNLRNEVYRALRSSIPLLEEKSPEAPTLDEFRNTRDETDKKSRGDQLGELEKRKGAYDRYQKGIKQFKGWLDSTSEKERGFDGKIVVVGKLKPGKNNLIKTRRMIIWAVYDDRDWDAMRSLPTKDIPCKVLGKRLQLIASDCELVARASREQFRIGTVVQATKGTTRYKILAIA